MVLSIDRFAALEAALPRERPRLVRLCAQFTGDADAAEDLAQETLLEAWRHVHKLHDPQGCARWLSAIARNVCLRWAHRRGRDLAHLSWPDPHPDGAGCELVDALADEFDVEVELERHELARLLDRALALLPPDTRAALIERYVEEAPLAEIAARLRLSESGLKARLHRGKLTLRRVLLTDFPDEAVAYRLLDAGADAGQETRIWCSQCGQAKLVGRFDRARGELSLSCPNCAPEPTGYSWGRLPEVFRGVKGYRPALSRQAAWAHDYFGHALRRQPVPCVYCGRSTVPHMCPPAESGPEIQGIRGISVRCTACHQPVWASLAGLTLSLPEGRRFWRRYPRIHALPEREIEVDGRAAIVTSYQSMTGSARLDVVSERDTFKVIGIYGAPEPGRD